MIAELLGLAITVVVLLPFVWLLHDDDQPAA